VRHEAYHIALAHSFEIFQVISSSQISPDLFPTNFDFFEFSFLVSFDGVSPPLHVSK